MRDSVTLQTRYATTSFPGSLFSASIVVEKMDCLFLTTMEAEKRDPGNEVGYAIGQNETIHTTQTLLRHLKTIEAAVW